MDFLKKNVFKKKSVAVLTAVSLAAACEFSRIYVPDFVENKFAFRMTRVVGILIGKISKLGSLLNFNDGNEASVFRSILYKLIKKAKIDNTKLKVIDTKSNNVPIRIYSPLNKPNDCPIMIYFHGGAYCLMNIDHYDELLCDLIEKNEMVIVSVDYRLAPESPFPTPLTDCYEASSYLINNLKEFELDFVNINRIILAGDSAGAHISTIMSRKLLEENNIKVYSQCLIYPPTQYINFSLPSAIKYGSLESPFSRAKYLLWHLGFKKVDPKLEDILLRNLHVVILEDESLKTKYKNYLNANLIPIEYKQNNLYYNGYENLEDNIIYPINISEDEKKLLIDGKEKLLKVFDINISPGLADDDLLKMQPKTLMIVCENDVRKDESLIYGERLRRNGVSVKTIYYEKGFHGLITDRTNQIAVDMRNKIIEFIKSDN